MERHNNRMNKAWEKFTEERDVSRRRPSRWSPRSINTQGPHLGSGGWPGEHRSHPGNFYLPSTEAQEEAIRTLEELSAIGLDIAANLSPERVFESFHHFASRMLSMEHLAIYRLAPEARMLYQVFSREDGNTLPPLAPIQVDDPHSYCARVARERAEIVVDDAMHEIAAPLIPGTHRMRSLLFFPLAAGDRLLGVISLQSLKPHAYGKRERFICRSLAAYGAIALENAEAYRRLNEATTALDRTNRSLLMQRDELDRANRAKTQFFAAASHDLRQPMQALLLLVGSLEHRTKDIATRGIADSIRASVEVLHELFDDLMDISKFDAGAVHPQCKAFHVGPHLERIRDFYDQQARDKNIELRVRTCSAVVNTDPILFHRILANLVNNAVRYTSQGRILIGCRRTRRAVRLEVWDTGPGIPEDKLTDIFREFFQLDNCPGDRKQGQGLGLAIVERAAKLLDHPLTVKSTVGKGTVFAIEIPCGEPASAARRTAAEAAAQTALAGRCVLVIDDDLGILNAMVHLLESWGCVVLSAKSGAEARDAVRGHGASPDAIISDYHLARDRTCLDLIAALHVEFGHSPSILISGDMAPHIRHAVEQSGNRLLPKPVAPAKLRALLSNLLKNSQRPVR